MKYDVLRFDPALLCKTPPAMVLLYGSDLSLIHELLRQMQEVLGEHRCLRRVPENIFLESPSSYLEPDLFSADDSHRFVVIEEASDRHGKTYQALLPKIQKATLILTSLKFRASLPFVQMGLKHPHMWAVPCYPLAENQLFSLFQKQLQTRKIVLAPDALQMVASFLSLEEFSSLLAKLQLLFQGDPLTPEQVALCFNRPKRPLQELTTALSGRDHKQVYRWFARMEQADRIQGLRKACRHFLSLLFVKSAIQQGDSLDQALEQLPTPIFFKELPLFKKHLTCWSDIQLSQAITLLTRAEILCKGNGRSQGFMQPIHDLMDL